MDHRTFFLFAYVDGEMHANRAFIKRENICCVGDYFRDRGDDFGR